MKQVFRITKDIISNEKCKVNCSSKGEGVVLKLLMKDVGRDLSYELREDCICLLIDRDLNLNI